MSKPKEIHSFECCEVLYTLEHVPGEQGHGGDVWRIMARSILKPAQPARQLEIFTDGDIAENEYWASVVAAYGWMRIAPGQLAIARRELGSNAASAVSLENIELADTLFIPIIFHDLEEVKRRVLNGYDVNTVIAICPDRTFTPLHVAAACFRSRSAHKTTERMQTLLMRYLISNGADVHARIHKGLTPLHSVAFAETVTLLLDHGADLHARSNSGNTPLHYAYNVDVAAVLLDHGADLLARDDDGLTAEELFKRRAADTSEEDWRASYLEVHQFLKSKRERQELVDIAKQTRPKTATPGSAGKRSAL